MLPDGSISILSSKGDVLQTINGKAMNSWNQKDMTKIRSSLNKKEMVTAGYPSCVMFEPCYIWYESNFVEFQTSIIRFEPFKIKNTLKKI